MFRAARRPGRRADPGGRRALIALVCVVAAALHASQLSDRSSREQAYRANNVGVAMLERFDYAAAADRFREALRLEPSLALAQINLAIALYYLPDPEHALEEATAAARLAPTSLQPLYLLGLIARDANRDADALGLFQRVLAIDPADIGSAVNIAQIYIQDRMYQQAVPLLRRAVDAEPFNITATYSLGLALTRTGAADEGQRLLDRSQALRQTGYGTVLSKSYLEQGRYAEAVASTGAEADLVDVAAPQTSFAAETIAPAAPRDRVQSPFGRTFTAADLADGGRGLAEAMGGGVALADIDGDGDLDVCVADGGGVRILRNDAGRFVDATAASGVQPPRADEVPIGCLAGDYDNDTKPDLFVLAAGRSRLYHNDGGGRFTDVTDAAGLPAFPFLPGAAAFVDVDHDGDLDLVVAGLVDVAASRARAADRALAFPRDFAEAPIRLLRNNGDGRFTDITRESGLGAAGHAIAIVPTDYDDRRDIDLVVVNRDRPPALFKNLRDGTFRDVASETGLIGVFEEGDEITSVAAGDVNKDGFTDLFFGRARTAGAFAMSDGRTRFTTAPGPATTADAGATEIADVDSDGLLDLIAWSGGRMSVARNVGRDWVDVSTSMTGQASAQPAASSRAVAVGDVDGDGGEDVVVLAADGSVTLWRSRASAPRHSVAVRLKGRVSNRAGVGAKIQMRAGSLSQRIETSSATPSVAPADVVFGLGARSAGDVVRVLWPSGILQAETLQAPATQTIAVEELDRKPSSCPFLYTWNGERFEFVTDFMGGGEMGYWEAPGRRNVPDPVEFVRIDGAQLKPRNGAYELRVTNELEETVYVDRLALIAVDHDPDVDIFPNEGMTDPPKPFKVFAVRGTRPVRAWDDHGHDVSDRVATLDRRYPDDFPLAPIRGYAQPHTLRIDIGADARAPVLLLTAWTDYAFSSDNVAGHQMGLSLTPPALDVKDASGAWRPLVADIGIPVGRPQTIAVDLSRALRPGERELRIATNMRIYWDRIAVAALVAQPRLRLQTLSAASAQLRERGYSAEVFPDGREPASYDYTRVSLESPWKVMPGRYTRVGDVRSLLARADDRFVVAKTGDEIALTFGAPPLADGLRRTFLLEADGFSKEMDINSASPDRVEPLPFHGMTRYPYGPFDRVPDRAARERYRAEFNTRVVARN